MQSILIMCIGIVAGRFLLPAGWQAATSAVQTAATALLIFAMGVTLGQRPQLAGTLAALGPASLAFCLLPTAGAVALVWLAGRGLAARRTAGGKAAGGQSTNQNPPRRSKMAYIAFAALAAGVACGQLAGNAPALLWLAAHKTLVLCLLMFAVGVGVGGHRGLVQKLRQDPARLLLLPVCTIAGSLAGGAVAAALTGYRMADALAIASGLGWYSLAGVTIESTAGIAMGSVAFLSNFMRELLSFFSIPWMAGRLGPDCCIAAAGATSEDTTLPMMMRYTDEHSVVVSVLHGVLCSAAAPLLMQLCYALAGG